MARELDHPQLDIIIRVGDEIVRPVWQPARLRVGLGRCQHHLHQAARPGAGNRTGVELGLLADQGMNQGRLRRCALTGVGRQQQNRKGETQHRVSAIAGGFGQSDGDFGITPTGQGLQ